MEIRDFYGKIFPGELWKGRFLLWWIVSLLLQLSFDLLWMGQTTFRPLSSFAFYPWLLVATTLLALPSLFTSKGWLPYLWLSFIALVMTSNLMYCQTYYNAIPLRSYLLVGNLADFSASVSYSFRWYFLILFIIPFIGLVLSFKIKGKESKPDFAYYFLGLSSLLVICWLADAVRGGVYKRIAEMRQSAYEASGIVPVYTLGGFLAFNFLESNKPLSQSDRKDVSDWLDKHSELYAEIKGNNVVKDRKKNLVVILCESLESWPIGLTLENKEITPFLNSLIKDSSTFYAPNILTQVGNGRSIDGQLLVLTGLLPMKNGVYSYDAVENQFFSLPKAIAKEGGKTYLLTCDKPYVWNEALVAEAFGIDTILHSSSFRIDETAGPSRRLSDGSFFRQSVEKLKKGEIWKPGENAFLLWVTYSGHNPFNLPDKLRRINLDGDYPEIIKNYLKTANYTDHSLKTLIEYLKGRPDWAETLVVITGDHEGLATDRKTAIEHPVSRKFVDPGQHTPLIILNSPQGGIFEKEAGQVDIYSTIIELAGLEDYEWKGMGFPINSADFPSIALGTDGEIAGDKKKVGKEVAEHIKSAKKVSDNILRFNLLQNRK